MKNQTLLAISLLIFSIYSAFTIAGEQDNFWGSDCKKPLLLEDVKPLLDKGLCQSEATFLGKPACVDWLAFLKGSKPSFPAKSYTVGGTLRVELAKNGSLVWSEHNPLYVIYNQEQTSSPQRVRIIDVSPESDKEEQEALHYLESTFSGAKKDKTTLDQFIKENMAAAVEVPIRFDSTGVKTTLSACQQLYFRKGANRQYMLIISKGSNMWEPDSHPILYFSIFPPTN